MLELLVCCLIDRVCFHQSENSIWCDNICQSESRLDNGVISINLSRTFFTGIGHVLEYIDQVLKIHSF